MKKSRMKRSLEKSTRLMKNRSSKKWHTTDRTQIIAKKLCLRAINEFHLAINEYHRIDNNKNRGGPKHESPIKTRISVSSSVPQQLC